MLAELEPHRDFIITGSKSAATAVDAKGKAPALDAKPGAKEGRAEAAAAGECLLPTRMHTVRTTF